MFVLPLPGDMILSVLPCSMFSLLFLAMVSVPGDFETQCSQFLYDGCTNLLQAGSFALIYLVLT